MYPRLRWWRNFLVLTAFVFSAPFWLGGGWTMLIALRVPRELPV